MKKSLLLIILFLSVLAAEEVRFNTLAYYEYSYYNDHEAEISNNFEFRRIYFGLDKKISNTLSYKFLTDVGRSSADGRLSVYIKNAKVDWNTQYGKFVIGMQSMNLFDIQKNTWGYRSIDKTAMNRNKWASSADLGLGYYNNYNNLQYNILITNGTGFKQPENDSYKRISTQVYYGESNLNSLDGMNTGMVFTYEPYHSEDGDVETKTVTGLFGGYASGALRAGAEVAQLIDSNVETAVKIFSGYSNLAISDIISIYARFDILNNDSDPSNYVIAGLAISPEKGLKIMPNIRYTFDNNSNKSTTYILNFEFKI
jgi:hypothetical protein